VSIINKVLGLIPARLNSMRLRNKVILPIQNLPIIIHVYRRVLRSKKINDAIICCDDKKIYNLAKKFGAKVMMTSKNHKNGTERICEAYTKLKKNYNLIVDIQGDEPLIDPTHVDRVIDFHFKNKKVDIIVPNLKIKNTINKNIVKIVSNSNNQVLYMSRLEIPFGQQKKEKFLKKHLSIVSFKPEALLKYGRYKRTVIEKIENIELLRALELGMKIKTFTLKGESFSVDVPDDYKKAQAYMKKDKIFKIYR
jgi:3-deoxy-manno-octulosonate cytidylyltransferase (CMP-KDO synthetase)